MFADRELTDVEVLEAMRRAENEMTEEEKDMVAVRCLRLFNVLLMLVGGGLTGLALYSGRIALEGIGSTLFYIVAAVGGSICLMTIFGLVAAICRSSPLLVVYYTWLVLLAFGMLVLGGFAFVFTDGVKAYLVSNWNTLAAALPQASRTVQARDALVSNVQFAMWGVGGICLLLLSMILGAVSSVVRLVTAVRAYTLLLQASNVTLLPVGIGLVAIATYVADTALGVEGPVLAFAVFIMGVFVISLTLLGCTGTSLRSRGLLKLFMAITLLLTLAFLAFGVASLALSSRVASFIVAQWANLRRVLPSGFSGKYDKDQFATFVSANLVALGFFALCTAALLFTQTWASFRLRGEVRKEADLEKEAAEAVMEGLISKEDAEVLANMRQATSPMEVCWKRNWTKGTKTSRCCIALLFTFFLFILLIIVGVATAALYYQTSCTQLDLYAETKEYPGTDMGPYAYVVNNVSRGTMRVSVERGTATTSSAVRVEVRKSAYSGSMAQAGWPAVMLQRRTRVLDVLGTLPYSAVSNYTFTGVKSVTLTEKPPTRVVGVDTSCQSTDATLYLPRAATLGGNSRAVGDARPFAFEFLAGGLQSGVEIDWRGVPAGDKPRIRRLDALVLGGTIELYSALIGSKGLTATAVDGTVTLDGLDVQCEPEDAGAPPGTGGVQVSTSTGAIVLANTVMQDCDVTVTGSAGTTQVTGSVFRSTLGGSRAVFTSNLGSVELSNSRFEVLEVKGEQGTVRLSNVTVTGALRVSTGLGNIFMDNVRFGQRATVQIETETGDIALSAAEFTGILTVVTGGTVSCSPTGSRTGFLVDRPCDGSRRTTEIASDGTIITVLERVDVNCGSSCAYMGNIAVTSSRGDVALSFGRWLVQGA